MTFYDRLISSNPTKESVSSWITPVTSKIKKFLGMKDDEPSGARKMASALNKRKR